MSNESLSHGAKIKSVTLGLLFAAMALTGCFSPGARENKDDPFGVAVMGSAQARGRSSDGTALENWRLSDRLGSGIDGVRTPAAVIALQPGRAALPGDAEAGLAGIARQLRENDRLVVRLEGYLPAGGSSAVNLGMTEKAMQLVKARLVELRVAPRRILMAPFGEGRRPDADRESGWIELHLVQPNRSARRD